MYIAVQQLWNLSMCISEDNHALQFKIIFIRLCQKYPINATYNKNYNLEKASIK